MQTENDIPPLMFEVEASTSSQKMSNAQVRQVIAHALIERLQHWCMQLFWMTVLCVINCCGDENDLPKKQQFKSVQQHSSDSRKKKAMKNSVEDIEQKMLRHLTSPYLTSPLRPVQRTTKKRVLSRPPSPQLFDIAEEE